MDLLHDTYYNARKWYFGTNLLHIFFREKHRLGSGLRHFKNRVGTPLPRKEHKTPGSVNLSLTGKFIWII